MNIIRELRKKKGVQQKELSIAIGVSQPTVSDWEKNKKDPSGENLKKLADFFGVDELIVMGRGVVDLTQDASIQESFTKNTRIPITKEAMIISGGVDSLSEDQRKKALEVMRVVFPESADKFM
jgi:transcriptional regulator with XRE-family HTH domain